MYDAYLKRDAFVIAPVICCLCDNVRASELLNHMGSKAKKLHHLIYNVLSLCLDFIIWQWQNWCCKNNTTCAKEQITLIRAQLTQTAKAAKQTEFGLKDMDNPF